MSAHTSPSVARFRGWISCRRDGEGPLGLILAGRTLEQPEESLTLAFSCQAPEDLPDVLEEPIIERVDAEHYRISSGDRNWTVKAVGHLHRDVTRVFYKAVPPRPVPRRKRLFWVVALALASHPASRWLLQLRG